MTPAQLAKICLMFLERAPIEGHEAEAMVLCKNWVRKQAAELPPPFNTAVTQVADTNEK